MGKEHPTKSNLRLNLTLILLQTSGNIYGFFLQLSFETPTTLNQSIKKGFVLFFLGLSSILETLQALFFRLLAFLHILFEKLQDYVPVRELVVSYDSDEQLPPVTTQTKQC